MLDHPQPERATQLQSDVDPRVRMTSKIWTVTIPVIALTIPLVAITDSVMIAVIALLSPALATGFVWWLGNPNRGNAPQTIGKTETASQQRLAELEERLANLETINNFERRLAEESLKRQSDAIPTLFDDENKILA